MEPVYLLLAIPILLEPFPVSSSSNATLFALLWKRFYQNQLNCSMPGYIDYLLHGPIACIVALFFYKRWIIFLKHPYRLRNVIKHICVLLFFADSITVLFYILFTLTGKPFFPLWAGFAVTAVLLGSLNYAPHKVYRHSAIDYCMLGIAQGLALLPGISRLGITLATARWLGFSNKKAFELSFLIEFPISLAAMFLGMYKAHFDMHSTRLLNVRTAFVILIASIGAWGGFFIMNYIIKHQKTWLFAWYTLLISLIVFHIS